MTITEVERKYNEAERSELIIARIDGAMAHRLQQYHEAFGEVLLNQHGQELEDSRWEWGAWLTIGGIEVYRDQAGDEHKIEFSDITDTEDGQGKFTRKMSGATAMVRHLIEVANG